MPRTWQTEEVIRQLAEADLDELAELIEDAGDGAAEALRDWIREGNGPKSLSDAIMRFTRAPDHSFDLVDWDAVVQWIRDESGSNDEDDL